MPDIALVLCYLFALVLSAAGLLKVSEFLQRRFKLGGGLAIILLVLIGLFLSGARWADYYYGHASLLEAIGASLLLGGLPFLVALSMALHELPFRAIALAFDFFRGKLREEKTRE